MKSIKSKYQYKLLKCIGKLFNMPYLADINNFLNCPINTKRQYDTICLIERYLWLNDIYEETGIKYHTKNMNKLDKLYKRMQIVMQNHNYANMDWLDLSNYTKI